MNRSELVNITPRKQNGKWVFDLNYDLYDEDNKVGNVNLVGVENPFYDDSTALKVGVKKKAYGCDSVLLLETKDEVEIGEYLINTKTKEVR